MAIELQIRGTFDLVRSLVEALLRVLPPESVVRWWPRDGVEFQIVSDLVTVSGFRMDLEAILFFRVRDKTRVNEGVNLVVSCADAVLAVTDGDLKMFFGGDKPLLVRTDQKLKLFLSQNRPSDEFWRVSGRSEMLHHEYRFVRERTRRRPQ